jgi:guanylate kinase
MGAKQVVVIAGPAGSGKDSVINGVVARCPNTVRMVTATTRPPRPGERNGVNYHFLTKEKFEEEMAAGNILEYYVRSETGHMYGTYKPDIEARIASGKVVLCQLQIVGATYMKEHYDATTFFIMPPHSEAFEQRVRERAPMSDTEWAERQAFTKREIAEEAPFYDYHIQNEDGKLDEAVEAVIAILKKEGFALE